MARDLQRTPTDVVLRKRFEERRDFLVDWLETQKDIFRAERQEVLGSFQSRLNAAQARVEGGLDELRSARRSLAALRADHQADHWRLQRKATRRALRHSRRVVKASLREWEVLLQDIIALHSEALIPATAS